MEWINLFFSNTPQKMVLVSVTALLVVTAMIIFYRYIWPKKRLKPWLVILLLTLPPLVSILRPGSYESGDMSINVVKAMSFYDNLAEGNLIPRWAGDLNAHYGYPAHLFAYPLPYYLVSLGHALGLSFISSIKLLLMITFVFSGIFTFKWLREEMSETAAMVGAVFYLYAPYHLINLHFRVVIGEMLAMMWLPFILWMVARWKDKDGRRYGLMVAGATAGLILSHQAISLVAMPFLLAYGIWAKKGRGRGKIILALVVGTLLAAYYWLPVLAESRFTHQALYTLKVWFPPWQLYFVSPWRWGLLFQGPKGELAHAIGYIQLILVAAGGFLAVKGKGVKNRRLLVITLVFWVGYLVMMLPGSQAIWNILSFLKNMQYAYRIMGVECLVTAVIGAVFIENIKLTSRARWAGLVIFLAVMTTILNWGNRRNLPEVTDDYLRGILPESTAAGEGLHPATPKWTDPNNPWQAKVPDGPMVIEGQGTATELIRKNTYRKYEVNLEAPAKIIIHTLYFPGWKLMVNGEAEEIDEKLVTEKGEIAFNLPAGKNQVELRFEDTYVRRVGMAVSLVVVIIAGFMLILRN